MAHISKTEERSSREHAPECHPDTGRKKHRPLSYGEAQTWQTGHVAGKGRMEIDLAKQRKRG